MQAALLYYKGSGPIAAGIRWFTKSKFAHVAPAIVGADGTAWAYNAYWSTGVTKRVMLPADIRAEASSIQVLPFCLGKTHDKQVWLDTQVGKPYDKWSIVIIGLTKRLPGWLHVYVSRQGEWICSRLSADFANLELECWGLNGPPSPEDIHRIVSEKYG